ncbi:hypothetical protein PMIN01_06958 [Paraphaeosphaeria minitans]|uniref:DUF3494 domain-containing protein n=1 Tax=Paraphaeosphaeria minitans TaxID=565426 RepID=A0A9P6GI56_9PLEO|nr:hypothetical protein PMIN01_06958 [Paraphaeosphaeria minitans]
MHSPLDLGTATPYGIIAVTAITNTGATVVDGLLAIFPFDATSIMGFPPGLSGGINAANDAANQARGDAGTAYNPHCWGLYLVFTGTLVLDAQNDPNTVFVFQIGSTLTTATASSVILINGAQACNVFWQVGTSATLGTATVFAGSILASASISVNAGVTVNGGLFALNGAVTLINDLITAQTDCLVVPPPSSSAVSPTSPVVFNGRSDTFSIGFSGSLFATFPGSLFLTFPITISTAFPDTVPITTRNILSLTFPDIHAINISISITEPLFGTLSSLP